MLRIAVQSFFLNRSRAIAAAVVACAVYLPGPLWGQSAWPSYPNNNTITVTSGGNVGIGAPNPIQKLQTEGSIAIAADYQTMGNGNARYIGIPGVNGAFNQSAGAYLIFYQGGDNGLSNWIHFVTHQSGTSVAVRMTIAQNGYVGIGTMLPQYLLSVKGKIG